MKRHNIDLDLRGTNQLLNSRSSQQSSNFAKRLKGFYSNKVGNFVSLKAKQTEVLFNGEDEHIKQVIPLEKDAIDTLGILTNKNFYIRDNLLHLKNTGLSIENYDYQIYHLKTADKGFISACYIPGKTSYVLTLDDELNLRLLRMDFNDINKPPNILYESYITKTHTKTPIITASGKFFYADGHNIKSIDPLSLAIKIEYTFSNKVESFFKYRTIEEESFISVKEETGVISNLKIYKLLNTISVSMIDPFEDPEPLDNQRAFPFFENKINGYTMLNEYDEKNDTYHQINMVPGSGFYWIKQEDIINNSIKRNDNVQVKLGQTAISPDKPPTPPATSGVEFIDAGETKAYIMPMIFNTRELIDENGNIPQPNNLSIVYFKENNRKMQNKKFGNQNILTGSILRSFDKGKLVEFGFNAFPELIGPLRVTTQDNFQPEINNITGLITGDDENTAYQMQRVVSDVRFDSQIDTDYIVPDENLDNIYPLPSLNVIESASILNRIYTAVFTWQDEHGTTHRSGPAITRTSQEKDKKNIKRLRLFQTFKVFFRKNETTGLFEVDSEKTKELFGQRWDYELKEHEEEIKLKAPLTFTKKEGVRVEIYSTIPKEGESSENFFLVSTLANADDSILRIPERNHIVACEDIVNSKQLGTYNLEELIPDGDIQYGRLLLPLDYSVQPNGAYSLEEHDDKVYIATRGRTLIPSEKVSNNLGDTSIVFKSGAFTANEEILDIKSQDNNLVIFFPYEVKIYNEEYTNPRSVKIPDLKIQEDNNHFQTIDSGIIFKDREQGFFLFNRANEFVYIGEGVDDFKKAKVLDTFSDYTSKQVFFITDQGTLIYNWLFQTWTSDNFLSAGTGCIVKDRKYFSSLQGQLLVEEDNRYSYEVEIETHFISFGSLIDKKRFLGCRIHGDLVNVSTVFAQFAINGSDNYQDMTSRILPVSHGAISQNERKVIECLTPNHKADSVKFRVRLQSENHGKISVDKFSIMMKALRSSREVASALRVG